jgi:arylsulfatase A-like enzyme
VPSIWVGGQLLHKQYVSSFPRMNALAKLLAHEQYEQWLSMDHILDVILPPSDSRSPLDVGVPVKNHRLCSTLAQIRSRLSSRAPTAPPIFAYSLPQDVHVSVVTSEGARPVDEHDYPGFYAPVASRVRRFDQCLGEFIDDLKAQGLYDQSVIVLTSDHGDSLGEEGRMGHAYSLHPEIVRVPLIIHLPPALRAAWTWDEKRVAFTTDITPTLYRLLGHEPTPPAPFFGESLALRTGVAPPQQTSRMIAASYGAVYGVLLAHATRYYVFDAVSMRDMAFELGTGPRPGAEVPMTADVQEQGLKRIRDTVDAIGAFYHFSTARDSALSSRQAAARHHATQTSP